MYGIGDSLVFGSRDDYGLHPVEILARKMSKKYDQVWVGVADGTPGETSAQLVRRFFRGIYGMKDAMDVIIWIGSNDAKVDVATPTDVYEENVLSLLRSAFFLGKTVYIGTLPRRAGFGAPDYMDNKLIDAYNKVIRALPKKLPRMKKLYVVELADLPEEMHCDGIHLTHEGNEWVAERLLAAMEQHRS